MANQTYQLFFPKIKNFISRRILISKSVIRLSTILLVFLLLICNGFPIAAQTENPSLLTLDRIVSKEFDPEVFGPAVWLENGLGYTVLENSAAIEGSKDIVRYDLESGHREILVSATRLMPPGESSPLQIESYSWSKDGSRLLIFTNTESEIRRDIKGDYWVLDLTVWVWRKLGGDAGPQTLMAAQFSPGGRRVCYIRDNNLYIEDLISPKITQLTFDGSCTIFNGKPKLCTFSMFFWESLAGTKGFCWSPDGKSIAYAQLNIEEVPEFYMINNTDYLYPRIISFPYTKVGGIMPTFRIGLVSAKGGETRWLEIPGDPRNDYIVQMNWAANTEEIVIQTLNRLQNTVKVMLADVATGKIKTILTESDSAWLEPNTLHWLTGGKNFLWVSERDGWQHIYLYSRAGVNIRLLTPGEFDVQFIQAIDEQGGWLYYIASPDNPTQRYLYRVRLDGDGKAELVTPVDQRGTHSYQVSPDSKWAFHTYSSIDVPPVTEIVRLPKHEVMRVLVDNSELRSKLEALKLSPTEFFRIDIGEGVELDGWLIKPFEFAPEKSYPLLFWVYGEPATVTVLDSWGGFPPYAHNWQKNRYLWHLMLAQQGYIIMSVDNRGTPSPRGRAWRKAIYRQLGILASLDQAAAAREIIKRWKWVDPERIGISGHSGGGQMSLNLIFRYPGLYHLAMPSSFVSNQRFYYPGYQERFMGLPEENVEGYKNGSPITWAHRLEGHLLIVHGTGDSNVHYQSFEALVNELVRARKRFTMMSYPNREHSLHHRGDVDTHYHFWDLLTRFLKKNIPPDPR